MCRTPGWQGERRGQWAGDRHRHELALVVRMRSEVASRRVTNADLSGRTIRLFP